jgi:hypothetical protein
MTIFHIGLQPYSNTNEPQKSELDSTIAVNVNERVVDLTYSQEGSEILGSGFSQSCRLQYFKVSMIFLCLGSVLADRFSQACHRCGEDTCGHSFIHTGMQEMMLIGSKFPSIHNKVGSVDLNLLGVCPTACLLCCSF